jgi:glucose/arabinose dehydrogenase
VTQLAAASRSVTVNAAPDLASAPFDVPRQLTVPAGFAIDVWARAKNARFIAVAPDGDVLVSQPEEGRITLFRPRENGSPEAVAYARGLNRPHDMVFHVLNGRMYLYLAEADRVTRFEYQEDALTLPPGEVIVKDLPTKRLSGEPRYRHVLKNLALNGDTLFVSIGSSTNANPADLEQDPKRGAIYAYDAGVPEQDARGGRLYANGLRNAVGLAIAPDTGALWVTVNERDETLYPFHDSWRDSGEDDYGKEIQSFVDNYPAEEIIEVREGAHYGWPFCNPNPAHGYDNMPFDNDVETNPDGKRFDCQADATPITKGIQAHTAPLGLSFWAGEHGGPLDTLVVALHGSWNRDVLAGYKVICYPYRGDSLGDEQDLVSGWISDAQNGEYWGRPVDAVPLDDDSLLISDDYSGTIYRLYRQG